MRFRFYNSLATKRRICCPIIKTTSEAVTFGPPYNALAAKLRHIKSSIRKWRDVEIKKDNMEILTLKEDINKIEVITEH